MEKKVVIVLHGIKTRGKFKNELAPILAKNGFIPEIPDYGYFWGIQFLRRGQREKKVKWFQDFYDRVAKEHGCVPSVIAHSFGTYLVCRAMQINPGLIELQRLILCGSIVQRDFDWKTAFDNGFVQHVLNDYGGLDTWAGLVHHFASDAGPSGKLGFLTKHDRLEQHKHPEWRHSQYFFTGNFERRWIPFLKGENLPSAEMILQRRTPWGLVILILIVIGVGGWIAYKVFLSKTTEDATTSGIPTSPIVSVPSQPQIAPQTETSQSLRKAIELLRAKLPPYGYKLSAGSGDIWTNFQGKRIWVKDPKGITNSDGTVMELGAEVQPLGAHIEEDSAHHWDRGRIEPGPGR